MWLFGAIAFGPQTIKEGHTWQAVVWTVLGVGLVWFFLLRPIRDGRRLRKTSQPTEPLTANFNESGIHLEAEDIGDFDRTWADTLTIEPGAKGVLFRFTDETGHWLPNRVFQNSEERQAFVNYVMGQLPKRDEEIAEAPR
jgi:hypothetical protein